MTAFFGPALTIAAMLGSVALSVSAANAMTVAKPASEASTRHVQVDYRGDDRRYRHQHRYDRRRGRHVVHAPFTRVESGRRTVVDAPFVHVYKDRHGKHIVAPFVDLYR